MTFDYKAMGLGQPRKNAHPECGVTMMLILAILFIAGSLFFR